MITTKAALWAEHVARFASSNISMAAYCRDNSLNYSSFCSWYKKLSVTITTHGSIGISRNGQLSRQSPEPAPTIVPSKHLERDTLSIILKSGHTLKVGK